MVAQKSSAFAVALRIIMTTHMWERLQNETHEVLSVYSDGAFFVQKIKKVGENNGRKN